MKRKEAEKDQSPAQDSDQDSDDGLQDIVDVDFDFYNPEPIDFHALKRLFNQLFSTDAELIDVGSLVDIIIEENHVGTTVKVDGQESDPYAILSVINLNQNKENRGVKELVSYLLSKCPKKDEALSKTVSGILTLTSSKHVGYVISERFINMPMEIMPPMYTMMQQETKQATEQGEAYTFEWYMFIAKTYKEVEPVEDNEDHEAAPPPKKKNKKSKAMQEETIYVQPEDELISKHAAHQFDFKFTNREKEAPADAKRAFSDVGIAPSRRLMFVHRSKFEGLVKDIEATCSSPGAAAL